MPTPDNNENLPEFPEEVPDGIKQIKDRKAAKFPLPPDEVDIIKDVSPELPTTVTSPLDQPVINNVRDQPQTTGLDTTTPLSEPVVKAPLITQPVPDTPIPTGKEIKKEHDIAWEKKKNYAINELGEKEPGSAPTNPAAATMTPKEEKESLKMSVETALYVYSKAKMFIGELFTTGPAKMRSIERIKKIKLDWAVDYDESTNQPFTFRQFITETNKKIIKACETSDEFKNKIRPLLEAEFSKRGWVFSYQQNLMFMVGQDLFETGQKLFMIHKNMNDAIKQIQTEVKEFNAEGGISSRQMYNMERSKVYVPYKVVDPAFDTSQQPVTQWPTTQQPATEITKQVTEEKPVTPTTNSTAVNEVKSEPATNDKPIVFTPPAEE